MIQLSRIPTGTIKATLFVLLIAVAVSFWLYTQKVFNDVRQFQRTIAMTHARIFVKITDPHNPDNNGALSTFFLDIIKNSPFPRIITDSEGDPIPGLWSKVGIPPDASDAESMQRLREMAHQMDRTNPPEPMESPRLESRVDTLIMYDIPPERSLPLIITNADGTYLYSRNMEFSNDSPYALRQALARIGVTGPAITVSREKEAELQFHGMSAAPGWEFAVVKDGEPLYWRLRNVALSDTGGHAQTVVDAFIDRARQEGYTSTIAVPHSYIVYDTWYLHYGDIQILSLVVWLPVIEFVVLFVLLFAGYVGFRNITNAEKQSVWVGMAKETAHQLGTPISSIGGWLELLRSEKDEDLYDQAIDQIGNDVERLTRVAARFSSIGSKPGLHPVEPAKVIDEVVEYFRARLPRMDKRVKIERSYDDLPLIQGNAELLNWAFENLIKNGLAAVESKQGLIEITGTYSDEEGYVIIDVSDNGRGIAPKNQKNVMKPGFTTKKRGWGLGLSLVKRIIEEYHNGKILLLESKQGEGATFRVILPAPKKGSTTENDT